jgi:F-type H+-transporting ATPase subunit b
VGIDPFTVAAQVINFLVLILVLKRFLYRPILNAMNARKQKIASQLEAAKNAKEEAAQQTEALKSEIDAFDLERERLWAKTRKELEAWQENAMQNAREEVGALRRVWLESLEEEKNQFLLQLKRRITEQVLATTRKVVMDLTGGSLENQLVEIFLEKMQTSQNLLIPETVSGAAGFQVCCSFEIDDVLKEKLTSQLEMMFRDARPVEFVLDPEITFGLQLRVGDWKMEWSMDWYLQALEKELLPSLVPKGGKTP